MEFFSFNFNCYLATELITTRLEAIDGERFAPKMKLQNSITFINIVFPLSVHFSSATQSVSHFVYNFYSNFIH